MKSIDFKQLKKLLEEGKNIPLINTLSEDHFENTQIPESINIPLESDDFVARVEQTIGGKDQPVVVYCASHDCPSSEKAAEKLEQAGFTQVYDFEGGAQEWLQEGQHLAGTR